MLDNAIDGFELHHHFLMVASTLKGISQLDVLAHQHIDLDSFFLLERKVKKLSPPDEEINISHVLSLAPVAPSISFEF